MDIIELCEFFKDLNKEYNDPDFVRKAYKQFDLNNDGKISFKEFIITSAEYLKDNSS